MAKMTRRSFKHQIILTFVVGFSLLIAVFVTYMVWTERNYLYRESTRHATALAESLAVSSVSWVLANDVAGLQEVVHSFHTYPELRYAMVLSPSGRVLAHSDTTKVGQFVADENSLAPLKAPPRNWIITDQNFIVDVVVPIELQNRHIGWARIALGREGIVDKLRTMIIGSALFVLVATVSSLLSALLLAKRLGRRVTALVSVAEQVQAGNREVRANIKGFDEFAKLGRSLNDMLEELEKHRGHLEELVAERTAKLEDEISERKRTEQELLRAKDEAEASNRAKSLFLANMSHELRTPLNAILGFSRLMQAEPDLDATHRRNLDIVVRSGNHLLTLINDVLDMSKIEAGRQHIEAEEVDLDGLIEDIADMLRQRAVDKGLLFTVELHGPKYLVLADAAKLRQVLINLVSNAVKFTQEGSVNLTVTAHPAADPKMTKIAFVVKDTGPGIDASDQQRIFQPFVQATSRGPQSGTGLGLTITREFVKLMGGEIALESEVGKGSTFSFEISLPVLDIPSAASKKEAQPGVIVRLAPGQPRYRILAVDDMPESRLLLRQLLEPVGFEIAEAGDGTEAVSVFESWRPQLILMDRRMPNLDGLEATRRIRSLPGGRVVKIIMLTASAFSSERQEIMDAGCDEFLSKPFIEADLFAALESHLGARFLRNTTESAAETPAAAIGEVTAGALAQLSPAVYTAQRSAVGELNPSKLTAAIRLVAEENAALADGLRRYAEASDFRGLWLLCKDIDHAEST
ncbi:MAG: domain S-box protein [Proteobacteria bacterium]|nr:domain S-box protein [Pseudomonadota bacterium]